MLIGAVTPIMLRTDANPGGAPIEAFDKVRAAVAADRSQFFKELSTPFHAYNRANAKVSQGVRPWPRVVQSMGHGSPGI